MRLLTLFTATLAGVLGLALGAQAATLSMTTDKASYSISETITLTITGTSGAETTIGVTTDLGYGGTGNGSSSWVSTAMSPLFYGASPWTLGGALNVSPTLAFDAISPYGTYPVSASPLTSVMTFHVATGDPGDTITFDFGTNTQYFSVQGFQPGTGVSVTIIPEPTTAGLMGLGLVGLAISGRRRKS